MKALAAPDLCLFLLTGFGVCRSIRLSFSLVGLDQLPVLASKALLICLLSNHLSVVDLASKRSFVLRFSLTNCVLITGSGGPSQHHRLGCVLLVDGSKSFASLSQATSQNELSSQIPLHSSKDIFFRSVIF